MTKGRLSIREVALFAILGSLTFSLKAAMMWLPNIEPVTLMVLLFAVSFGIKCLYPIYVYVALEFLVYGVNLWAVNYLYVWAILALAAHLLRDMRSRLAWAVLAGAFGLLFGLLCAPVYIVTGGIDAAVAWWISGIPFDVTHCIGNFVLVFALFPQLRGAMERFLQRLQK